MPEHPLAWLFRDAHVVQNYQVADRERDQERSDNQQPYLPAAPLLPFHPSPGDGQCLAANLQRRGFPASRHTWSPVPRVPNCARVDPMKTGLHFFREPRSNRNFTGAP